MLNFRQIFTIVRMNYKRIIIFAVILIFTALNFSSCQSSIKERRTVEYSVVNDHLSPIARQNLVRAYDLAASVFPFLALTEGDHGEGKPYHDKAARWTVWYGSTVKPDGSRVQKNDPWIPREQGKEYCFTHLFKHVFPYFKHFNRRFLTDEMIICTSLFIYNAGGEAVTGYDADGNKTEQGPSAFFLALNSGKSVEECVNYLTGFRKAGGRIASGLLKRRWLEGAVLLGILTPENVMHLMPEHFYATRNLGDYYWLDKKRRIATDGDYYKLRYDHETVEKFFKMNTAGNGQKSVGSII